MDTILHQLGGLLLGSVPTILLFLLIVLLYRWLVYGPLTRVLDARRERTSGAVERAAAAIAAAATKGHEYETRLRSARAEIFEARERRLQQWNRDRERMVTEAREAAQRRIAAAKAALEAESEAARRTIEGSAGDLAHAVLQAILPGDAAILGSTR